LPPCLGLADDRVAKLVAFCAQADRPLKLPDFAWLANSQTPTLVRFNMRLYYARWLAENNYDDEAISWTDGLSLTDVVSPEALLFYRAIANHRLVRADQADVELSQLLQRPDDVPVRYQSWPALMQKDLAGLDDESLVIYRAAWLTFTGDLLWAALARPCKAWRTASSRRSIR